MMEGGNFYQRIVEESTVGYVYHKIVTDDQGKPCDYIFLEVNDAFEEITGLRKKDILGKTITEVLPEIKQDRTDWIAYFGEVALKGVRKDFVRYSDVLKKWYKGNAFSPKPGFFVISTIDFTIENHQINGLKKIKETTETYLHGIGGDIPYQKITEILLDLAGGEYAAFNLYDEPEKNYRTVAIAGDNGKVSKVLQMMGKAPEDMVWKHDERRDALIRDQIVTRFSSLEELAGTVIPGKISRFINERFGIGEILLVKIMNDQQMIGDFTVFMGKEAIPCDTATLEMYGSQLGLMIERGRMEKAIGKINRDQRILLEISSRLMEATSDTLDRMIGETMEIAAKIAVADRVYLFEYDFDKELCKNTYEWCGEGISPQIHDLQSLPLEEAKAWLDHHREKKTVVVDDVHELEEGDPIKAILEPQEIKSTIAVPLFLGETLYGFVGFDSVKEYHRYTDDEKSLLNQYGNGLLSTISRITNSRALKKQKERIEYLSLHDHLTGLYNRRFFETELKRMDTERNLPITLIMGDLNGLKLVNDSFGHRVGDELLMKAGEVMRDTCRNDEIIARIGGDEYALILPKTDPEAGERVLRRIREALKKAKVRDLEVSVSFGYGTKTSVEEDMNLVMKRVEDQMYNNKLFEGPSMRGQVIENIIEAINKKSPREEAHSQRVSEICVAMGEALGMKEFEINELRALGLLHDIGKIAISDEILNKPGPLSPDEYKEICRHSEIGYRILSTTNDLADLAEYVLSHHERWDGKGYPKGLKGNTAPIQARICSIADAFDAMTSDRSYRKAMSEEVALDELRKNAGTQFDPNLVEVFISQVKQGEIE